MSEALQITGTSLGLRQAKERSTKHAWLNIALTFNLSSTLSHLCLKLNQPSAIWKSNPPHFISLLKAHPQSLSPLSHTLSFPLLPARCNPEETICFAPSSEIETVTDEGALWWFSANDYSPDTSVKPAKALYLSKSQCDAKSRSARKRRQVRC